MLVLFRWFHFILTTYFVYTNISQNVAPAKIEKAAKSHTAHIGDTVAFKCDISGNPIPSVTWGKGKRLLKDEGRVLIETAEDFSELEIENVVKSDEGEYTCLVKNDFGEDTCSVTLTVRGKNRIPELPSSPASLRYWLSS